MSLPDDVPFHSRDELVDALNLRLVARYLIGEADLRATVEKLGAHWGSAGASFGILGITTELHPAGADPTERHALSFERWHALQAAWRLRWGRPGARQY